MVTVFFFSTIVTFGFVSTFAFAFISVLSMIRTRDELRGGRGIQSAVLKLKLTSNKNDCKAFEKMRRFYNIIAS